MSSSVRGTNAAETLALHGTTMRVRSSKNGKRPKSASALPQKKREDVESRQAARRESEPKHGNYSKPILRKMVQLARTSDVYGSFLQPTVAQSLDLIRRCIQQRSKDGAAFSSAFKRFRGEVRHLTLSSFRATMIRMGINIPEPHYEALFNLFDNDRSGTIDFEEFSYWVMQGTADPERAAAGEAEESDEMSEAEREMLLGYVCERLRRTNTLDAETFKRVLTGMTAGRPGLIARAFKLILSRMNIGITEREGLAIFNTIDQDRKGIVTIPEVIDWWEANITSQQEHRRRAPTPDVPTTFEEAVMRTTQSRLLMGLDALHEAFEGYLQHSNHNTRLYYDEFRHAIRKLGIGKNERDMKCLFSFFAGDKGYATLSELLRRTSTSFRLHNRPSTALGGNGSRKYMRKKRRLEREMREGLRLTYVKVKHALEARDQEQTEHLRLETIKAILDAWCRPITYHDLRVLVQEIPRNENDDLNYRELLHYLHPRRAGEQHNREHNLQSNGNGEVARLGSAHPRKAKTSRPTSSSSRRITRPRTAPSGRRVASPSLPLRTSTQHSIADKQSAGTEELLSRQSTPFAAELVLDTMKETPRSLSGTEDSPLQGLVITAQSTAALSERSHVQASSRSSTATESKFMAAEPPGQQKATGLSIEARGSPISRGNTSRQSSPRVNARQRPSSAQSARSATISVEGSHSAEAFSVRSARRRPASAHSQSCRSLSPSPSPRRDVADIDGSIFTKLQERLKPKWKLVKIAFHELDSKQTGLVTQHNFQLILRIFDVFQMMNDHEFVWLSAKYRKGEHIWYVGFLRDLLSDVQHITAVKPPRPMSARPPRSKPLLDSPRKPAPLRKSLLATTGSFADDLSTVSGSDDQRSDAEEDVMDDDNRSTSSRRSTSSKSAAPTSPSLIARVAPFVVASWKDIRVKLKALQSADYPGNVTAADLSGILYIFGVSLSSKEVASLPHSFPLKVTVRSRTAPRKSLAAATQLVDYNAFMRACFQSYRA